MQAMELQATKARLLFCALSAYLSGAALALPGDLPRHGGGDTTTALVVYGDGRLLDEGEALSDERLNFLLDSLGALDPAPHDLIRDLRLYKRIRSMDEEAITVLIDSLFEQDTVPYALINEINMHVGLMPSAEELVHGRVVPWTLWGDDPGTEHAHQWNTRVPHTGQVAGLDDAQLQLKLIDGNCGFAMPICGVLTSRFGWRDGRAHNGVDIDLEVWDKVHSAFPGVVRYAGTYGGYGRLVVVRHVNGLETYYAHLHRIKVQPGDEVEAGDVVGLGGSSGHSTGSHLHFEVRFNGIAIDPAKLIDMNDGLLLCDTLVLKKERWSYAAYPKGTEFHTVGKGDHLYAIAERYGVSIDDLCVLNGITPRHRLRIGRQLLVNDLASY